jgi:hypothetical protein
MASRIKNKLFSDISNITRYRRDIYHIGLPLTCIKEKHVILQLHPLSSKELKYLDLAALSNALSNDPDLASMDPSILPKVIQTLFITSGCDYISFFCRIGKGTFLRYFFQYASFITAANNLQPQEHSQTQA